MARDDLERLKEEYANRQERFAASDIYSPLNPSYLYAIQQRQRAFVNLMRDLKIDTLSNAKILEIGSGQGDVIQELSFQRMSSSQLYGHELLSERVERAKERFPGVNFTIGDAQSLPYSARSFDMVLQYTVFSSILEMQIKTQIAKEMRRVVKQNGLIVWYDFWLNPTNPQTRGICKAEIKSFFPDSKMYFRKITLAPPLSRRIVPISWTLAHILERLTILNTHYLVAIKANSS